eukprot:gnl/TRDRNA2_/TRDRNA2_63716_c0_seq1.p1 gnl/TRDRNA2_/TRDRNA2_63716_c0~~gnl/TRDRNA2_/TRDRNA2_63716_c0_seq1.p1  ORF type:complete len:329 (-),score=44.32 gnl/TRDRNA2_/TRDRNA2_63716_c0_seq1:56-1018(-)
MACPPKKPDSISAAKKYGPDFVIQIGYVLVCLCTASLAHVVLAGFLSAFLLIFKNSFLTAAMMFQWIDDSQNVIKKQLGVAKKEIGEQVSNIIKDLQADTPDTPTEKFATPAVDTAVKKLVQTLSEFIDDAAVQLTDLIDAHGFLPWFLITRIVFLFVLAMPCVIVNILFSWGGLETLNSRLDTEAAGLKPDDAAMAAGKQKQMIVNMVFNMLFSLLRTWPVQVFICNAAIGSVEWIVNEEIRGTIVSGKLKMVTDDMEAVIKLTNRDEMQVAASTSGSVKPPTPSGRENSRSVSISRSRENCASLPKQPVRNCTICTSQ